MTGAIPPASWPSEKRAICLEFPDSRDWEALILGILKQLSYGYYWDKTAPNWEEAKATGLQVVLSFMDQIRCDAGAIPIEEPQCDEYPNNSPMLDWQPMNPFLDPGKIPPGYIAQPWGVVGAPPILGYDTGDVISGLFGLPVLTPALGQGLARVRVKFNGKGTVEIHLVKVIAGGMALVTHDDNPLTAFFVDLSFEVLAIPPESSHEDIQEIVFDTDGDHHIDITILPRFSTEAGFAGYGGGIRKVVLCGPDMQIVDRPPESGLTFDEFPGPDAPGGGSEVAICDVIRWNNGVLQVWCCNEWQDAPAIGTGAPGSPTQPPPSSPPEVGSCFSYKVALNAKNQWLLPFPVSAGDTILISDPSGGWNDGSLGWFCPTGQGYSLGICGLDVPAVTGDPLMTANHMQIIGLLGTGTDYFNPLTGVYTVPFGTVDEQITFQANDSSLSDNSGDVLFTVKVCKPVVSTWCAEYDLTAVKGPVHALELTGGVYGEWVSGTGWQNHVDGSGAQLTLVIDALVGQITHVEFDLIAGTPILFPDHSDIEANNGATSLFASTLVAGLHTISWDGPPDVLPYWINGFNYEADAGILTITRLKVSGTGVNPFGETTCA